jgi:hypothetical protein
MDFLDRFKKKLKISDFMKIRPVGTELRTDGRTDGHDDVNSLVSQFCERAQNTTTNWFEARSNCSATAV